MAKPKKKAQNKNKKKQQVKKIAKPAKVAKKITKKGTKIKKVNKKPAKKQTKYDSESESELSEDEQTPQYDEETSNPVSENSSEKSWKDGSGPKKKTPFGPKFPIKKIKVPMFPERKPLTLKEQAEKRWDNQIKYFLSISPADAVKEIDDKEYDLFSKLQLGNELTDQVKKIQKLGQVKSKYIYTPAQLKQFKTISDQLISTTVKQLQEELVKNGQPKTDVKAAVLERVIDGRVLGKIPKCPNCFGGRLRFNNENGTYLCPGYVDGGDNCVKGDDYIFCFRKYNIDEIQRETWQI